LSARQTIEDFVRVATQSGWRVERRDSARRLDLPEDVLRRYGALPASYDAFLREIALATSADEGVWFVCEGEFRRAPGCGFLWNEIERMALAASADAEEKRSIVSFWDVHLPIMMAPNGDYDYLAIAMGGAQRGTVVHGYAPESERVERVADSFDAWLAMFSRALREPGSIANGPLALRVMAHRPQR
jgi:hypothetical protein